MKTNKKATHQQRQILDQKIESVKLKNIPEQKSWIKSVRSSLGITLRQMAALMKMDSKSIARLEMGEVNKTITLKNLFKAADVMECRLIYFMFPKNQYESFDDIIDKKAEALAFKIAKGVSHSMSLEKQKVSQKITDKQIKQLAYELRQDLDPRLWLSESKIKK